MEGIEGTEGTTEGTTEGGNLVFPAVAYGMMVGASALGIANQGWGMYQNYQRLKENERYWNDYYKNTGVVPVYPYRSGAVTDYLGFGLQVSEGVVNLYSNGRRNRNEFE